MCVKIRIIFDYVTRKNENLTARRKIARTRARILIQHPEQPQRNFVAEADFYFVCRDETIGNVLDLREFFALAADFKKVFVIDEKVAFFGELY